MNDLVITPNSSIDALRTAGRFLRVSTSGSKQKIFNRIRVSHISSLRLRALEVARGEHEALQPHPWFLDAPDQPTTQERKLHEVTHLPFKKWCSVWVQSKSKMNHQKPAPPDELSQRSCPTVQCDFCEVDGNLNVLIMANGGPLDEVHRSRTTTQQVAVCGWWHIGKISWRPCGACSRLNLP